ncbi:MAG: DUF1801 domain-containing protein [Woeseiaceae bacterium]|nr:DUF1801 domain-containing protein [Woeseiaceae bacterium]
MAENKTQPTKARVGDFLDAVDNPKRRADARKVLAMMRRVTGKRATMWGSSIIGFGKYQYRYESGREGEFMLTGLSPRKQNLAVYIIPGFEPFEAQMKKLGKYKTGRSCLYINKLEDVDEKVLEKLIDNSVKLMRKRYNVMP